MHKIVLSQIKKLTDHQLYTTYKIIVNSDGSVYDKVNKKTFICLVDWANDFINKTTYCDKIAQ